MAMRTMISDQVRPRPVVNPLPQASQPHPFGAPRHRRASRPITDPLTAHIRRAPFSQNLQTSFLLKFVLIWLKTD